MGDLLSPAHLVILVLVALLVFGPRRLPELGGSIGKAIREFQKSMKDVAHTPEDKDESKPADGGEKHE